MTKKDAFYFSHDSNARNDLKMVKLRRKEGLAGIGLFWCIIEMLRESKGYELPIDDIEDICYELRCEEKNFDSIFACGLLEKKDGVFYSISLKNRLAKMDEMREKRKIAGSKGGKAKASNKQNASKAKANSSIKEDKIKEDKIKEDKIKEDKIKEDKIKEDKELASIEAFNFAYSIYPRKKAKQATLTSFKKLLKKHTAEDLIKSVENFNEDLKKGSDTFIYTSNNFFGQKAYYLDYLPENYNKTIKQEITINDDATREMQKGDEEFWANI